MSWVSSAGVIALLRLLKPASSKGQRYQIVMAQRSVKSSFMPNALVFPGGKTSRSDFAAEWTALFAAYEAATGRSALAQSGTIECRWGARHPTLYAQPAASPPALPTYVSLKLCAIRECFEESGLLIARPVDPASQVSAAQLDSWRAKVRSDDRYFIRMMTELKLVPDVWALREYSNWLTPLVNLGGETFRHRFDAIFYLCDATSYYDAQHPPTPDGFETVKLFVETPSDYLRLHCEERIWLAPPQLYELVRMSWMRNLDDVLNSPAAIVRKFPINVRLSDRLVSILPGDSDYPEKPDLVGDRRAQAEPAVTAMTGAPNRRVNRIEFFAPHRFHLFCNVAPAAGGAAAARSLPTELSADDVLAAAKL